MSTQHACELFLEQYGLPAVGLARIGPDGVEEICMLGERRRGSGISIAENDQWHIGSCTKSMTSTMMARLVERGQLQWDMLVGPVFAKWGMKVHPGFATLTLRHLLTHRSGIARDASGARLDACYDSTQPLTRQRAEIAAEAMMQGPTQRPGEAFCYSNLGYMVAGALAEGLTGMAWEDLMQREFFAPLGFASGGFGAPGCQPRGALSGLLRATPLAGLLGGGDAVTQPWGHQACTGPEVFTEIPPFDPRVADNAAALGPAGTIHLSLPDFATYVALHASQGATAPGYLTPETFAFLHTSLPGEDYAFGWATAPASNGGSSMIWHEGTNQAWLAAMMIVPDTGRAWAFVTNAYMELLQDPQSGVLVALGGIDDSWLTTAVA